MALQTPADVVLDGSRRDTVDSLADPDETPPAIVSISDIHGYLMAARSALLTLRDHPELEPVVVADDDGRLHWADENYVLVFNGDLVDRGPANDEVLALVERLIREAPPGRVRVTLGNHEAIMLSRDQFGFSNWYSGQVDDSARRRLCEAIIEGHVVAAYRGHSVTYAHAGAGEPYDVTAVNDSLVSAAKDLQPALGTEADLATQREIISTSPEVLGVGTTHLKGPEAGLSWIDFDHLPADAPPQVVGHTRHDAPQVNGQVYCQNVIRNSIEQGATDSLPEPDDSLKDGSTGSRPATDQGVDTSGGEAVFVEHPDRLSALVRQPDGGVVGWRLSDQRGETTRD